MKKISIWAIAIALVSLSIACNPSENTDTKITENQTSKEVSEEVSEEAVNPNSEVSQSIKGSYGIESGKIVYESNSMGLKSTITTYFKDNGGVQASETSMEVMGVTQKTSSIKRDGFAYVLNHADKTLNKVSLTDELGVAYADDSFDFDALSDEEKAAINLKELPSESVASKKCRVFTASQEDASLKYWIWENILLKMEITQGGMSLAMEAKTVDENWKIDEAIFTVPVDYKVINLDNQLENMDESSN